MGKDFPSIYLPGNLLESGPSVYPLPPGVFLHQNRMIIKIYLGKLEKLKKCYLRKLSSSLCKGVQGFPALLISRTAKFSPFLLALPPRGSGAFHRRCIPFKTPEDGLAHGLSLQCRLRLDLIPQFYDRLKENETNEVTGSALIFAKTFWKFRPSSDGIFLGKQLGTSMSS